MEGPRIPGYYASVTGIRPPGESLRRGEMPSRGPVALIGQVHRYGPKQAKRTYVVRVLLNLGLPDIELVWQGPEVPVPAFTLAPEWKEKMDACMAAAEAEADRLTKLDPHARGL